MLEQGSKLRIPRRSIPRDSERTPFVFTEVDAEQVLRRLAIRGLVGVIGGGSIPPLARDSTVEDEDEDF